MTCELLRGNGWAGQECDTRKRKCDGEGGLETNHVGLKDFRKLIQREDFAGI